MWAGKDGAMLKQCVGLTQLAPWGERHKDKACRDPAATSCFPRGSRSARRQPCPEPRPRPSGDTVPLAAQ